MGKWLDEPVKELKAAAQDAVRELAIARSGAGSGDAGFRVSHPNQSLAQRVTAKVCIRSMARSHAASYARERENFGASEVVGRQGDKAWRRKLTDQTRDRRVARPGRRGSATVRTREMALP
jgi:hypothetical protein